jgi:hypothetical protein
MVSAQRRLLGLSQDPAITSGSVSSFTALPGRGGSLAKPATIVDGCADLLQMLDPVRRRGFIAWLAVSYYDGYRPGRAEIAELIADELSTTLATKPHLATQVTAAATGPPRSPSQAPPGARLAFSGPTH